MSKKPLQIRDLPSEVREALVYRADEEGRSLAQQATVELRRSLAVEGSRRRGVAARLLERLTAAGGETDVAEGLEPEGLIRDDRER